MFFPKLECKKFPGVCQASYYYLQILQYNVTENLLA